MSDLFAQALDEFHAAEAATPQSLAGSATVRARVAQRRKTRLTTLGVVGALAVVVPIGAFAANPRGNNPPPSTLGSTGPTVDAMTWQEHSGILTPAMLFDAEAPVPTGPFWEGCPDHIYKPNAGHGLAAVVGQVAYPNLDDNPDLETVVLVTCVLGGRRLSQLVAYDVDSHGRPVSMGAVVQVLDPNAVQRVAERPNGQRGVLVAVASDMYPPGAAVQEREYAWDGTAFRQVAGPTSFPPRRSGDLSITATGPLQFDGGSQSGSATVTVKNKGTEPTPEITIELQLEPGLALRNQNSIYNIPGLQPGESKDLTVSVIVEATFLGDGFIVGVYSYILDTHGEDNFAQVMINRR